MSNRQRNLALGGLTLCAAVTFFSGAKIATLLPVTDAGQVAWARAFSSTAEAAQIEEVPQTALPVTPEEPSVALAMIVKERALLDVQKQAMVAEEAQIALAREALRVEADRLSDLRGEVQTLLDRVESRHQADVDHLVDLYGTMKPKEAATLLTQMDLEVVVYVMTEMEPRRGAPILAAMPSQMAQAISRVVLERGKLPGDQRAIQVTLQ